MKKNEKLELLLNKVVEYDKPNILKVRGFLYKNNDDYYIKIIEIDLGGDIISVDDHHYLNDSDEQYITQSEKPKLMRVSLKSWHYRLVKFVLGKKAPTPKTMQNGCPYFWLLIFSIFVLPFVISWVIIKFILLLIPKAFNWLLQQAVDNWMNSISDEEVYDIYRGREINKPISAKLFFNNYDYDLFSYYLKKKHNLSNTSENFNTFISEMGNNWEIWRNKINETRKIQREKEEEIRLKRLKKLTELERKREISIAKWDARLKPIESIFNSLFNSIRQAFTFNYNWKILIKRTKQFVGGLITLILLAGTYFIVNGLTFLLMLIVDWSIAHWIVYAILGLIVVGIGLVYVQFIFIINWVENIVSKYKKGKRIWYVEPIIYLIWYPIKYVVLGLVYGFFYIICIPIKFVFYNFLFKLILAPLGVLIWKMFKALGHGLVNSTGVFGEYFNASYTDYCPGIEWVDTEDIDE